MSKVRTITPLPPADFTPNMGNYKTLQPFRYWCQKVLPLVYDDSLSYYELLCKVVDYLNKTMEDVETLHGDVTNLHTAYEKLQSYVNDYFSTLDVQEEINKKLDELVESGRLDVLLNTFIPYTTPEMFGAKGDGVTDDTNAFLEAMNNSKLVLLKNKYFVTNLLVSTELSGGELHSETPIKIKNGGKLKNMVIENNTSNVIDISSDYFDANFDSNLCDISLENLTIKNNNLNTGIHISSGKHYQTGVNGYQINGLKISNVNGVGQFDIFLHYDLYHTIDNCWINNCYHEKIFCNSAIRFIKYSTTNFINATFGNHTFVHCDCQYIKNLSKKYLEVEHCVGLNLISCYAWDYFEWFNSATDHQIIDINTNDVVMNLIGINDMFSPEREIALTYTKYSYGSTEYYIELGKRVNTLTSSNYNQNGNILQNRYTPFNYIDDDVVNNVPITPIIKRTDSAPYSQPFKGIALGKDIQLLFDSSNNVLLRFKNGSEWSKPLAIVTTESPTGIGFSCSTYRPPNLKIGTCLFDTTINKPIWYDGTKWVLADGTNP